jgi:hypothetical protein
MGRKLTDAELNDPDFQALMIALNKAARPVSETMTERVAQIERSRPSNSPTRTPAQLEH